MGHTSSDHSSDPEQRLPPRVLGQRKNKPTKTKRLPWYRHTAWFIPLVACVVFAVLIVGGLVVRQVIVLVRGENTPADVGEGVTARNGSSPPSGAGVATDEPTASLESSDPGYLVLLAAAAKEPGRKLPKVLLVGRHREMFPTLESAVEVAIPGDFIEIRTNGPLQVRRVTREFDSKSTRPLTIRAGRGFQPVLKSADANQVNVKDADRNRVNVRNLSLIVRGLHFAGSATKTSSLLSSQSGDVTCEDCSFTSVSALTLNNETSEHHPARTSFRRCLFRASNTIAVSGPNVIVELVDSAFVHSVAGNHSIVVPKLADNLTLEMHNCTFASSYLLRVMIESDWPTTPINFKMHRCIFSVTACCPGFVDLNIPGGPLSQNTPADRDAFLKTFRQFDISDNLVGLYGENTFASGNGGYLTFTSLRADPTHRVGVLGFPLEQNVDFSPRYQQANVFLHSGDKEKIALGNEILRSFLPEDLVPKPEGLWAEQMAVGIRYGCDPAKLPVPPPATLQ